MNDQCHTDVFPRNFDEHTCDHVARNGRLSTIPIHPDIEATIQTINMEMQVMGYSNILCSENGEIKVVVNTLAENMLRLIQANHRCLSSRSELESHSRRVEADLIHVQKLHKRCQDDLEEAKRISDLNKERERQSSNEKKLLNQRLKSTTDELRKLQLNFQRRETQFSHERRKLEKEAVDLRHRLATVLHKPLSTYAKCMKKSDPVSNSTTDLASQCSVITEMERGKSVQGRSVSGNRSLQSRQASGNRKSGISRIYPNNVGKFIDDQHSTFDSNHSTSNVHYDAQFNLQALVVKQLESRQYDMLYENRELRDLLSQISSRIFRFKNFVQHYCLPSSNLLLNDGSKQTGLDVVIPSVDFDSLDESDEDTEGEFPTRNSSDDDLVCSSNETSNSKHDRRSSANVNNLLLELPYALVRDHITRRIRYLSRSLWRELKLVAQSSLALTHRIETVDMDVVKNKENIKAKPVLDQDTNTIEAKILELQTQLKDYELRLKERDAALKRILFCTKRGRTSFGCDSFGREHFGLTVDNPDDQRFLNDGLSTPFGHSPNVITESHLSDSIVPSPNESLTSPKMNSTKPASTVFTGSPYPLRLLKDTQV